MIFIVLMLLMLQTPTASLEGVVLREGNSEPLANVRVILAKNEPTVVVAAAGPPSSTSVNTNSQGQFAFKGIEPGLYRLLFEANGYVRQEYGQRSFPGNGSTIRLIEGENRKGLTMRMTPTATVSGRIINDQGRPLAAVQVRLLRQAYNNQGNRTLRRAAIGQTDERGEYRLFFVTPGRYYLNAGTAQGPGGYGEATLGPNELRETYANRYYPGGADLNGASPIDVGPGATLSGMDLTLAKQATYRVRGQVVDGGTGSPPGLPTLRLHFTDSGTGQDYSIPSSSADAERSVTYAKGAFEFRGIVPGTYYMSASEVISNAPSRQSRRTGIAPVQVNASDVEGVVVTIPPGFSIPGRVRVEGSEGLPNAFVSARPSVSLRRATTISLGSTILDLFSDIGTDGAFRFDGATAGPYRVVFGLNPAYYVKEARYGLADVLNPAFEFTGRESQSLEIILSPNVAAVDGVVTNNRGETVVAAQVALIPDRFRDRPELFKSATTDQNGRFTITNAAPGDYKVFAWEGIEPYAWFDPAILKRDDQAGRAVRVAESSRINIDLRSIPAR